MKNLVLTNSENILTVPFARGSVVISFQGNDGIIHHYDFKGTKLIKLQKELMNRIDRFQSDENTKFHKFTCVKFAETMKVKVHAGCVDVWDTLDGTGYYTVIESGEVSYERFKPSNLKAAIGDLLIDLINKKGEI